jgi:hypothetical protein
MVSRSIIIIFLFILKVNGFYKITSVAWQHSPHQVELGINAQGWGKVAEADETVAEMWQAA